MDTSITNTQISSNTKNDPNLNLHHPSINSHSPTLHLNEEFNSSEIFDIEMIAIRSVSYTSLKDLLPTSPSTVTSPPKHNSGNEIPIRNPLVKQAALAYLQPMSSPPPDIGERGLFGRLKESCSDQCGCVLSICDVVWRNLKEMFWKSKEEFDDDDDDDDDDDETEN